MRLKYANGRLRSFVNIIMYSSIILAVTGELFGSSCLKEEALSKFRRSQIWVGSCSLERAFEDNIDSWIEDDETGDIYRYRWCWI